MLENPQSDYGNVALQFQGDHKENLYWGTYRPHVYFGIRSR